MTDTTTEAVERLAQTLRDDADANERARYQPYTDGRMRDAAATLRALAQERDAARIAASKADAQCERDHEARLAAEAERDAARAQVERYRIALADLVSWQDAWPKMAQRLSQEGQHMQDAVTAARAVLAGKDPDAALAATEEQQ